MFSTYFWVIFLKFNKCTNNIWGWIINGIWKLLSWFVYLKYSGSLSFQHAGLTTFQARLSHSNLWQPSIWTSSPYMHYAVLLYKKRSPRKHHTGNDDSPARRSLSSSYSWKSKESRFIQEKKKRRVKCSWKNSRVENNWHPCSEKWYHFHIFR